MKSAREVYYSALYSLAPEPSAPRMSFRYRIDAKARLVLVDAEGATQQAERLAAIRGWMADPDYRAGHDMLCDFSKSTSVPSLGELQEIISLFMQRPADTVRRRLAVVAIRAVRWARQFQDAERRPAE